MNLNLLKNVQVSLEKPNIFKTPKMNLNKETKIFLNKLYKVLLSLVYLNNFVEGTIRIKRTRTKFLNRRRKEACSSVISGGSQLQACLNYLNCEVVHYSSWALWSSPWIDSRHNNFITRQISDQHWPSCNLSRPRTDNSYISTIHVHFTIPDCIYPSPSESASITTWQICR